MEMNIEADYVVVGAGAMGMAFTDALIDHAEDLKRTLRDAAARHLDPERVVIVSAGAG